MSALEKSGRDGARSSGKEKESPGEKHSSSQSAQVERAIRIASEQDPVNPFERRKILPEQQVSEDKTFPHDQLNQATARSVPSRGRELG